MGNHRAGDREPSQRAASKRYLSVHERDIMDCPQRRKMGGFTRQIWPAPDGIQLFLPLAGRRDAGEDFRDFARGADLSEISIGSTAAKASVQASRGSRKR